MMLPCLEVGYEALAKAEHGLSLEWLVTDGTGSYASSSVIGCNTRRYHGLLVAAQRPPGDRAVLLSKVEEELWIDGETYPLSTNEYPGCFHPDGYKYLVSFRLTPLPEWTYAAGRVLLRKRVVPLRGRRAFALCYDLRGLVNDAVLRVIPLVACRGFHELSQHVGGFAIERGLTPQEVVVRNRARGLALHLHPSAGEFEERPAWFHRVTYRREIERAFSGEEELFSPGVFVASVTKRSPFTLTASCESMPPTDFDEEQMKEEKRLRNLVAAGAPKTDLERSLILASDAFIVRSDGAARGSIIAGYPWFDCWGRDALIALEGLTLLTRRFGDAREILLTLADRIRNGLVPNFLAADPRNDAFNSIDASLWFIHATSRYHAYTTDDGTVREHIWPRIKEIVEAYLAGTLFGIRVDEDGLVTGGDGTTQLTWMDAKVRETPVTPRHGKAVEVNALWYNALRAAAGLAKHFGLSAEQQRYEQLAQKAQESFTSLFWNEEEGYLCDHVTGHSRDRRLRPNQILAVSLPYPVLERSRWEAVVCAVRKHLYTPYGLRSLAPSDPEYRGTYIGGPEQRDSAYHQGTVWPWLLGPFCEAYLKAHDFSEEARDSLAEALLPWTEHLLSAGVGSVSEVFDGDAPHEPRGCIAQAWSVAELLRASRLVNSSRREQATPEEF